MSTNHGNIISFPVRKAQPTIQVQHAIGGVGNKVHTIEKTPSSLVIYWERDTRSYYPTSHFLRTLFAQGYVSISASDDSDITHDSIMSVTDDAGGVYELPVDYFIQMTAESPRKIENTMQSILEHISNLNIRVGMHTSDASIARILLTKKEIECYKPEEISGFTSIDSVYECEMYHEFGIPIGWGEIEMFDVIDHHITLLDLMIISLENTEVGGYKIAGATMKVISIDGSDTAITTITADLWEQVIHDSLKRINPLLYGNMSFQHAHQHYFQKVVVPKIRPESK